MVAVGIAHHLRNYASAGAMSALVGLATFPLLTRNLSVAEYGIVGLITSSITLFVAVGKLGVQHAVIRFFSQIKNANIDFSVKQMNSTVGAVFALLACITTLIWLMSGFFLLPGILQYEGISRLFLFSSGIVFIRLLGSGVINFLRAQQRSGSVALAISLSKFMNLSLILMVLLASTLNPGTVIVCLLIAELTGIGYAAWQYRSDFYFAANDVSSKLTRAMLIYGAPLMILESLGLILRLSDRYLIEAMLGVSLLGQYSASYNLTAYLDIVILATLFQALKPAYMNLWESEGKAQTKAFLSRGFYLYMIVGIPFVTLFALTSPYLLGILSGPKYAPGTAIIPYVAFSFWMEGAMQFLAAGLFIFKHTKVLMFWSLVATVTNIILNLLLIPRFGISGAAIVTVLSYAIFLAGVGILGFRYVSFELSLYKPTLIALASAVVYALLGLHEWQSDIVNFLSKGVIGTATLMLFVLVLVPELRTLLIDNTVKLKNRLIAP